MTGTWTVAVGAGSLVSLFVVGMMIVSGCAWSGLDYLVDGTESGAPDAADGSPFDAGDAPQRFTTFPPNALLPSEQTCAAWVNANPSREYIPENAAANATTPTVAWLNAFHENPLNACGADKQCSDLATVTGAFTGTTETILRWAACKWGIDEDVARALAYEKSSWRMSTMGNSDDVCHSRNVPSSALNYWSEPSPCKPSKGLFQLKLVFMNAAPYASTSSALNADVAMGIMRACMNGDTSFLATTSATPFGPYPPTTTDNALWG